MSITYDHLAFIIYSKITGSVFAFFGYFVGAKG
jgi:hypothetical protein